MSFIKDWTYRLRHNRGFGVQSPAAFHFVMHVLREYRHPYYCYTQLNAMAGNRAAAHYRRLFRIANYVEPRNLLLIADTDGCASAALSAGCTRAPRHSSVNTEELEKHLNNTSTIGLLYIGETPHYAQAMQAALSHVDTRSVIIVEDIHKCSSIGQWWKSIVADRRVVISMDLYNFGILFFDTEYKKQHYTFWFK